MPSDHKQILNDVQSEIQGIGLSGISSGDVVQLMTPEEIAQYIDEPPAVIVSPMGIEQVLGTGTNKSTDIGWPVAIIFVDKGNQDNQTDIDKWLQWRQDVWKHFEDQANLVGPARQYDIDVEPGPIVDRGAWYTVQRLVGMFGLRVKTRRQKR